MKWGHRILFCVIVVLNTLFVSSVNSVQASQCASAAESGEWKNQDSNSTYLAITWYLCDYEAAHSDASVYYQQSGSNQTNEFKIDNLRWTSYENRNVVGWSSFNDVVIVLRFYFSGIDPKRDFFHGGEMTVVWEVRGNDGSLLTNWTEYYYRE